MDTTTDIKKKWPRRRAFVRSGRGTDPVTAVWDGETAGLVIALVPKFDRWSPRPHWRLTHESSGLGLGPRFMKLDKAKRAYIAVRSLLPWSDTSAELRESSAAPTIKLLMHSMFKTYDGWVL